MLLLKNIDIRFRVNGQFVDAVNGVQIAVNKGQKIGIIGESGSGKTQTAMSAVALIEGSPGLISGEIWLNGNKLYSNNSKNRSSGNKIDFKSSKLEYLRYQENIKELRGNEIGLIFQDARASLIPYKKIKDQAIETWNALGNKDIIKLDERLHYLVSKMNFKNPEMILDSYPNQLSGGEAQRAYIILALLGRPSLLIADEPTSSLDPFTSAKIIDLIHNISEEEELSLLIISHSLDHVARVTDYIYVFLNGMVVEELKKVNDKRFEPIHPYTKFLFSMAEGKAFRSLRSSPEVIKRHITDRELNDGCPYKHLCSLKTELNSDISNKCESIKPNLFKVNNTNRVSCWAYGES